MTLSSAAAWAVHALYRLGSGLRASARPGDRPGATTALAFLWLVAATVIDATDGVLARAADVKDARARTSTARGSTTSSTT